MLEEALRVLGRRTGHINWEQVIASRVDAGVKSIRCKTCGGSGYIYEYHAFGCDDDERVCETCGGDGETLELRDV